MDKSNQPIGVFDSGVGGLSVLIELKQLLPREKFVFFADQQYSPYGEKNKKGLINRGTKITNYFIKHHNIKLMVIACNTATANTIETLRKKYTLPIVGTIPAIKTASENTKTGEIAVISTTATSKSAALKKLVKNYCKNIRIINIGSPDLAGAVEQGNFNNKKVNDLLEKYLKEVKDSGADHLVLGCTHYPFLKKQISKILGSRVQIIDSGRAIARRTKSILESNSIKSSTKHKGKTTYLTTGSILRFSRVASKLLKSKIKAESIKI